MICSSLRGVHKLQFLMNLIMSFLMIFVYIYDREDGIRGFKAIWGIKGRFKSRINFAYLSVACIVLTVTVVTAYTYSFNDKAEEDKVSLDIRVIDIKIDNKPSKDKYEKIVEPNYTVSKEEEIKQKNKEFFLLKSKSECELSKFSINEIDCKTHFDEGIEIYNRTKVCLPSHSFYGIYYSREAYSTPLYIPVVTINGEQYFSNMKKFKIGVPSYTLETALVASCNLQSSKNKPDIQKATNVNEFNPKENDNQNKIAFYYGNTKVHIVTSIEQCSGKELFQCNDSFNYAKSIYERVKSCNKDSELYGVAMVPSFGAFPNFEPAIETPIIKIGNTMFFADGTPFESGMQIDRDMFERNLLARCKE